jgi:hypothetical protein
MLWFFADENQRGEIHEQFDVMLCLHDARLEIENFYQASTTGVCFLTSTCLSFLQLPATLTCHADIYGMYLDN